MGCPGPKARWLLDPQPSLELEYHHEAWVIFTQTWSGKTLGKFKLDNRERFWCGQIGCAHLILVVWTHQIGWAHLATPNLVAPDSILDNKKHAGLSLEEEPCETFYLIRALKRVQRLKIYQVKNPPVNTIGMLFLFFANLKQNKEKKSKYHQVSWKSSQSISSSNATSDGFW